MAMRDKVSLISVENMKVINKTIFIIFHTPLGLYRIQPGVNPVFLCILFSLLLVVVIGRN